MWLRPHLETIMPMRITRRVLLGSALAGFIPLPTWAAGTRILTARGASLRLLPEPAAETAVCGFDGQVPGPLFRCRKGEDVAIQLVNRLDGPLSFACQGMRLENAMDGVAGLTQAPIPTGQSFAYRINAQEAGFYFYRSLVAPNAGDELRQGLYGAFIVDEAEPPATDRDITVILADWQLDDHAQIFPSSSASSAPASGATTPGKSGGTAAPPPQTVTSVNSKPAPLTELLPPGSRVRLRLLNAVSARIMFVAFDRLKPMVLAIDSAPCEAFEPLQNMLPIGPGARFDVMFDLPAEAGAEARLLLRSPEAPDQPLLIFKTEGQRRKDLPPIASLPPNPLLPAAINLKASRKLDLSIDGGPKITAAADPPEPFRLGGLPAKDFGEKPLFSVARGTPVTLGLVNKTAFAQQIHVHGFHLRLLHDLDDGWEPYWRDSVIVPAERTKHVAFVADNLGKWAIECLPLGLQAPELVTWFEVT
jgi:FtsP/CotA-like multicopper oxidase with cupredoxin domain